MFSLRTSMRGSRYSTSAKPSAMSFSQNAWISERVHGGDFHSRALFVASCAAAGIASVERLLPALASCLDGVDQFGVLAHGVLSEFGCKGNSVFIDCRMLLF